MSDTPHTAVAGELADTILRWTAQREFTPVIVTPRYLRLRCPFFVSLAAALVCRAGKPVRYDWCRPGVDPRQRLTGPLARLWAARVNRQLATITLNVGGRSGARQVAEESVTSSPTAAASLVIAATVGRPGGPRRPLVIGLSDDRFELPPWTIPITLTCDPNRPRSTCPPPMNPPGQRPTGSSLGSAPTTRRRISGRS